MAFDPAFSFKKHVSNICRSAFYHICDIRRIKINLNKATAISLANAPVSSRLDYCNSLLFGCSEKKYKTNLQRVQNCLARVVTRSSMLSESRFLLKSQHWLPIKFKLSVLTYIFGYSLKSQVIYCILRIASNTEIRLWLLHRACEKNCHYLSEKIKTDLFTLDLPH